MGDKLLGGGRGPWVMRMSWHDLLFAHWRVAVSELRRWVPAGLEVETYDGSAWIGVVPFYMSGVRGRGMPPIPTTHAFAEINVRTYVTDGESRGVWFFSLDAESRLAVKLARWSFCLNYYRARMVYRPPDEAGWVDYHSERVKGGADFAGQYRAVGEVFESVAGSLDEFLTERYCLFAATNRGRLWRGDIAHRRWPLQRAEAEIARNTMAEPLGVPLRGEPHLLFAKRLDVRAWRPVEVGG